MLGERRVNQRVLAMFLVSMAVSLNLVSAVMLKEAADMAQTSLLMIAALITLVFFINLLRVVLWASIHKRFRLSDSYPLTSLFFPMILALSALYGEDIGLAKLIGTFLITLGVLMVPRYFMWVGGIRACRR
jgi:multidrug transporter EmrE-like cation transporter